MNGYSPKLPLRLDNVDGSYAMNQSILDTVKQNFKMLLLTNPGEKVMDPKFGAGLKKMLFENDNSALRAKIIDNINTQTKRYLNFINIRDIRISEPNSNENYTLYISILYTINGISDSDLLDIKI